MTLEFKKLVSLLLAVCLICVFSGCGQEEDVSSSELSADDIIDQAVGGYDDLESVTVTGDGSDIIFDGESGVFTPAGDTVRELEEIDATIDFVGYNQEGNVFVFNVVNNNKDGTLVSIQDVHVFDGENTFVQDIMELPVYEGDPDDEDAYNEYNEALYRLYICYPDEVLNYSAPFSRIESELSDFVVTVKGYWETVEGETVLFDCVWTCKM